MKDILIVALSTLLAVEFFFQLPFNHLLKVLIFTSSKSARVAISKKISDHWKEIILLRYAKDILINSIRLALIIAGTVIIFFAPMFLLKSIFLITPPTVASLPSQLTAILTATIYIAVRKLFEHQRI